MDVQNTPAEDVVADKPDIATIRVYLKSGTSYDCVVHNFECHVEDIGIKSVKWDKEDGEFPMLLDMNLTEVAAILRIA